MVTSSGFRIEFSCKISDSFWVGRVSRVGGGGNTVCEVGHFVGVSGKIYL